MVNVVDFEGGAGMNGRKSGVNGRIGMGEWCIII